MSIAIRPFRLTDVEPFFRAVRESIVHLAPWLPWCTEDYHYNAAKEWVESAKHAWQQGTDYRFVIEDQQTGELLGSVGINQIIIAHKIGNLGYWVKHSALQQGVCTKAARLAIHYAFTHLDFQRIEVHVLVDNLASNAVAHKLGGQYEGICRNKLFHQGQSKAAQCYAIIPSDYGF